jgi:hypothetical protein
MVDAEDLEGSGRDLIEVLSQNFAGGIDGNHEKHLSRWPVSRQVFMRASPNYEYKE